jgi:hypothetical protein
MHLGLILYPRGVGGEPLPTPAPPAATVAANPATKLLVSTTSCMLWAAAGLFVSQGCIWAGRKVLEIARDNYPENSNQQSEIKFAGKALLIVGTIVGVAASLALGTGSIIGGLGLLSVGGCGILGAAAIVVLGFAGAGFNIYSIFNQLKMISQTN